MTADCLTYSKTQKAHLRWWKAVVQSIVSIYSDRSQSFLLTNLQKSKENRAILCDDVAEGVQTYVEQQWWPVMGL